MGNTPLNGTPVKVGDIITRGAQRYMVEQIKRRPTYAAKWYPIMIEVSGKDVVIGSKTTRGIFDFFEREITFFTTNDELLICSLRALWEE